MAGSLSRQAPAGSSLTRRARAWLPVSARRANRSRSSPASTKRAPRTRGGRTATAGAGRTPTTRIGMAPTDRPARARGPRRPRTWARPAAASASEASAAWSKASPPRRRRPGGRRRPHPRRAGAPRARGRLLRLPPGPGEQQGGVVDDPDPDPQRRSRATKSRSATIWAVGGRRGGVQPHGAIRPQARPSSGTQGRIGYSRGLRTLRGREHGFVLMP